MSGLLVGLDIGGTKTHAIVLDPAGRLVSEVRRPSRPGADGVMATAREAVAAVTASAGCSLAEVAAVGVGIPGRVDPATGVVHTAVNLHVDELPLGALLMEHLGLPVAVENDVKAAAFGVVSQLPDAAGNLLYLNFGTGVAAAAIREGRLIRGLDNVAGEIGHLSVDPHGQQCLCGQRGCLELTAGGGPLSLRLAAHGLELPSLLEVAADGDPHAGIEADRLLTSMTTAILVMALAHGSSVIALNGGVIHNCRGLLESLRAELAGRARSSAFLASLELGPRLHQVPADSPVAAVGAALIGQEQTQARLLGESL
ncbi:putative NBD/HSP70 family sugar kinase [Propionicimonas paludicola]|uniref:Putative NBD/HSP70 family sugar kinase n=1 Tax=Propionicimonas paludicola TaxID=185243 RepID=A0A2A9CPQ8_9ACTN|nr:ROK family protein [Propionicimonas paludicola]PFG16181.1 putative NBD/HSP70 family sugar kinase [Propionicimonas paludicola]